MSSDDLIKLRDFASALAKEAGEITLRYFAKDISVERKSDGSVVTVADREAEAFLRAEILKAYPEDGILGEEEGEREGTSGRRWILDPIDGTYTFVHGVPLYGVLIGVEIEDEPTVGVVCIPALGELVSAAKGTGCFWNGRKASVSTTASLREALLLSTDFGTCESVGLGAAVQRLQERVLARRTWGDCYGYVLVATGRADVMLDPVMNVWDCAAILPIVEEAGGTFTDWKGHRTIRGGNSIATNARLFDELMDTIRE
jgi:histidinol-phosphatase